MAILRLGLQNVSRLEEASSREWLLTNGLGEFAMGTVSGLRTRSYHCLLTRRDQTSGRPRQLLLALDPVVRIGGQRIELGTRESSDGTIEPSGHRRLTDVRIIDGVPRWRWSVGDVVLERELAMVHGHSCVVSVLRVVAAPGPVELEVEAVVPSSAEVRPATDGFDCGELSVRGGPFTPAGEKPIGVHFREEAARGLAATAEELLAGRFHWTVSPGAEVTLMAAVGDPGAKTGPEAVTGARERSRRLVRQAGVTDEADALLVHAADQFVIHGPEVIAGYPWFGAWSRDTLTAYEGLFLATRRWSEGAALLRRLAATLSEGMLANTADWGSVEYNSVDAPLWFLYAVGRHVDVTGDLDLARELRSALREVVAGYRSGTRFGIVVDTDALVTQGADGMALTWMDARVDGVAITPRRGKPVEVNALWIAGLWHVAALEELLGTPAGALLELHDRARDSFRRRFPAPVGLFDVVDGPAGDDPSVRPNQLLAVSLRHGPFAGSDGVAEGRWARRIVAACAGLTTALGPRSLDPGDAGYAGRFDGDMRRRDSVYHQGTVWPWLAGAQADAWRAAGRDPAPMLDGLLNHLLDAGLGSVSEVADGDPPQLPGGCPFQAWSVAELLRARRTGLHAGRQQWPLTPQLRPAGGPERDPGPPTARG